MEPPKKPEKPETERPQPQQGDWGRALADALKKKKTSAGFPEPRGRYGNEKTRRKP